MPDTRLVALVESLFAFYGPQNWWPARTRLEVVVGAVLVQNTAWVNVERALANLRRAGKLHLSQLQTVSRHELEALIRPAGFYRRKAAAILSFIEFLARYGGSLATMFALPTEVLRSELLGIKGIGAETADSILLYAGGHSIFVVDAYTRRILDRHRLSPMDTRQSYDSLRLRFEGVIEGWPALSITGHDEARHPPSPHSRRPVHPTAKSYQELHAMIVRVGSTYCRTMPNCDECPLRGLR